MAIEFERFKIPQKFFELDYLDQLYSLLPKGVAWIFDRISFATVLQDVATSSDENIQDSIFSTEEVLQDSGQSEDAAGNWFRRLLSCLASELERVETDAWDIFNQSDPGVATNLLEDHERELGLPEACFADVYQTIEERQRIAHNKKYKAGQTTTKTFLEEYGEGLGFDITVEEIPISSRSRRMGVARMGVERMGGSSGESILRITINSGTGNEEVLRCAIEQLVQAHVVVTWVVA